MAAAMRGSRTPSPSSPSGIRTPPAPRYGGFHDNYQPFAPRKSARLADRTPSPRATRQKAGSPESSVQRAPTVVTKPSSSSTSPMASPRKRRQPHSSSDPSRRVSGALTAESTHTAATALGLEQSTPRKTARTTYSRDAGMLPTPSKTPQKPPTKETSQGIQSFARHLFQNDDELMPANKRRVPKKYSGMTLDSFTADVEEEEIEIFTDSKERVPEVDDSAENPFLGEAVPEPVKRRSKRKNVSVAGEKAMTVEEASERKDGMIYVFRGKRFFRKFAPEQESSEVNGDEASLTGPLSHSRIKPRLLFAPPSKPTPAMDDVDEEAVTDIEDATTEVEEEDEPAMPQTPVKRAAAKGKETPQAPKFAPVSPPDTKRTTRSTNKLFDEATPIKKKDRRSPFDTWPRTKDRKETTGKRGADEPLFAPAKRTKA